MGVGSNTGGGNSKHGQPQIASYQGDGWDPKIVGKHSKRETQDRRGIVLACQAPQIGEHAPIAVPRYATACRRRQQRIDANPTPLSDCVPPAAAPRSHFLTSTARADRRGRRWLEARTTGGFRRRSRRGWSLIQSRPRYLRRSRSQSRRMSLPRASAVLGTSSTTPTTPPRRRRRLHKHPAHRRRHQPRLRPRAARRGLTCQWLGAGWRLASCAAGRTAAPRGALRSVQRAVRQGQVLDESRLPAEQPQPPRVVRPPSPVSGGPSRLFQRVARRW